jgi:hypothetical protein
MHTYPELPFKLKSLTDAEKHLLGSINNEIKEIFAETHVELKETNQFESHTDEVIELLESHMYDIQSIVALHFHVAA